MTDGKKRLECLRKVPAHKLVISVAEYYRDTISRDHKLLPISGDIPAYGPSLFPIMPYGPTIDESEEGLLGVPVELMEAGRANFVPIILGANKNGGNLILDSFIAEIVPGTKLPADNATVRRALDWFLKNDSKTAQELYSYDEYKSDKQPDTQRLADLLRDCTFQCPNRRMARIWSQHGQPTYLYTFSYDLGPVDRYVHGGDFHASELPFVFGTYLWALKLIGVPAPKKISEDIQSRWTSFVKYGSPNNNINSNNSRNGSQNTNSNVYWPRFDENSSFSGTGGQYMSLKLPNSVKSLRADNVYPDNEFPSALKCDFWDKQKLEWEELRQHPEKID
jgi:carboxylesterase type B